MKNETFYWFGFRQIAGEIVVGGPFNSWEEAKIARSRAKAGDCQVSIPFIAPTKEEAIKEAKVHMP